jgi:hypothetical protein
MCRPLAGADVAAVPQALAKKAGGPVLGLVVHEERQTSLMTRVTVCRPLAGADVVAAPHPAAATGF